jgi:membrane protease YdiL (CAAX protease family)
MDQGSAEHSGTLRGTITIRTFLVGVLIIAIATYVQYITDFGTIADFFIVYGIPIAAVTILWGRSILMKAFGDSWTALKYGLGFFSVFTIIGTVAGILIFYLLSTYDPSTIDLLNRPNPVLQIPEELALIMVAVSLVVIGPAEEYLFRGFIYGGLLSLFRNHHWLSLAFVSSLLFAGMHLYYATVYGVASLIIFADLITFGMAMAATYYISGGNLVAPALIHGSYDAIGFLGIATTYTVSAFLRVLMLLIALAVGLVFLIRHYHGQGQYRYW